MRRESIGRMRSTRDMDSLSRRSLSRHLAGTTSLALTVSPVKALAESSVGGPDAASAEVALRRFMKSMPASPAKPEPTPDSGGNCTPTCSNPVDQKQWPLEASGPRNRTGSFSTPCALTHDVENPALPCAPCRFTYTAVFK